MPKIEIDVDQVLTCAVFLEELRPGDRLLVMNGVVIGMIEPHGRAAAAPLVAAVTVASAPAPVATPAPVALREQVKALIAHHGPISGRQISKRVANGAQGARVAQALKRLRDAGEIAAVTQERFPAYRLA